MRAEPRHTVRRRDFLRSGAAATCGLLLGGLDRRHAFGADSAPEPPPPTWSRALRRGAEWLWDQQAEDGTFRSTVYGLLRSGQSLTPFALLGLIAVPEGVLPLPSDRAHAALAGALDLVDEQGALGFRSAAPDYPCYATGMLLSCLAALRPPGWREEAAKPLAWLRAQQMRSASGWAGHPAQGGWGMGSGPLRSPPHAGHVDLSMTRRAVDGLLAVGVDPGDPALREARDFAIRCQAEDGGFFYSPVELALNKGGASPDGMPRGYGSATTDGVMALLALGGSPEERPLRRAQAWLTTHHRVDRNPGIGPGSGEPFAEAMRGYYRAGAAACFARLGDPDGWRADLARALVVDQREDGSWRNSNGLQKEDDPIIATAFAVAALSALHIGE